MAEPFKNLINAAGVQQAAARLKKAHEAFDTPRFEALALEGLDTLEMKARAMQIAGALEATLPVPFDAAATLIESVLASPVPPGAPAAGDGLAGWMLWPVGEFVARRGLQSPGRALATLHALTQRFTAEWAIRPFIVAHPALAFATLQRWTTDPSEHVRRLASEGSRPRLPWGLQLKALVADPSPTLPLLAALQDDPSDYVRRSVANHLNDIAKDHPAVVAEWLETHLPGAPAARAALLRHASRTLIKAGDRRVLACWGLDRRFAGQAALVLAPTRLQVGDSLALALTLQSTSRASQKLAIDYVVHHVKADGRLTPKVFKGWTLVLDGHAARTLNKRHSMREITTRRYHPGRHLVEIQINGQRVAEAAFDLQP
ncbi:DNA alkylation repair protein [Pseudorhodoferax sp.]|uniref:DNA alkylation repair protein n=1 Tax=Pseudorhodoferax sp. TaxID=1993553 RepID=UPI002DD69BE1|nr:DNA alkylation repair protein [Pseudorhodoferax sp.]